MQNFRDGNAEYWISDDILAEYETDVPHNSFWGVKDSLGELGMEFVRAYGGAIGAKDIGILCAHGSYENRKWKYSDNRRMHLVQSWIDTYDGKYALLALRVCNPGAATPIARKSLLLIPDSTFSDMTVAMGMSHFSLVHPTEGDLEYTLEYHLKELTKS